MDAQTTPTHNTLWHKGFAALSLANVLLTTAVYMMMAVAAGWLRSEPLSPFAKGCIMGAYGIGLFLLGPLCSFLVERYRRNHVCELAVASLAAFVWLFGLMDTTRTIYQLLSFSPYHILHGQVWRLVTFALIPEAGSAFSLIIATKIESTRL